MLLKSWYGWVAVVVGMLLAFFSWGGSFDVAVVNFVFWVGVLLVYVGIVVAFFGVTTLPALGIWLLGGGVLLLVVGYFRSTSAIWLGVVSLLVGGAFYWFLRDQAGTEPVRR